MSKQEDLFKSQTITVTAETQRQWSLTELPKTKREDLQETMPPGRADAAEPPAEGSDPQTASPDLSRDDPTWITERVQKKRDRKRALIAGAASLTVLVALMLWLATRGDDSAKSPEARGTAAAETTPTLSAAEVENPVRVPSEPKAVGNAPPQPPRQAVAASEGVRQKVAVPSEVAPSQQVAATEPKTRVAPTASKQPMNQAGSVSVARPTVPDPAAATPARPEAESTPNEEKPSWFRLEQ